MQCFYADAGLPKVCVCRSAVNLTKRPLADRSQQGWPLCKGQGAGSQAWLWHVAAMASLARSQVLRQPWVRITDRLLGQCSLKQLLRENGHQLLLSALFTLTSTSAGADLGLSSPGWPVPHVAVLSSSLVHPAVSRADTPKLQVTSC